MHHPPSIHAARRMRIASLLLLCNRLLIVTAGALLLASILANDPRLMIYGIAAAAICILFIIAQSIAASHTDCPLCRTPVLASMKCMKHRKAKRLLGSYRMRVALGIIIKQQFRCPYCHEPTELDVGERLSGSRPRGVQRTKTPRIY